MCWSIPYTVLFAMIYVFFAFFYAFAKPKYWREYVGFSLYYLVMELFQLTQWLFGDVKYDVTLMGTNQCSAVNTAFTYVAYILIWGQPVLFAVLGLMHSKLHHTFFKRYVMCMIGVFIVSMCTLILGSVFGDPSAYHISNSVLAEHTCTSIGSTHHLAWQFKTFHVDMQPNYFAYLAFCIISFVFYENQMKYIAYGWALALGFTMITLNPAFVEIASTWCLFSVFAEISICFGAFFKSIDRGN